MATFISRSPEETFRLGEKWGGEARPGWVIGLNGDLGAGKTQLVKGLAAGLGITARVHSPTFAIVNIYPGGRLALCHIDLYRLDSREQIIAAGLEELVDQAAGVVVIEWAERWFGSPGSAGFTPPPPDYRRVHLECLSESERRIIYDDPRA